MGQPKDQTVHSWEPPCLFMYVYISRDYVGVLGEMVSFPALVPEHIPLASPELQLPKSPVPCLRLCMSRKLLQS